MNKQLKLTIAVGFAVVLLAVALTTTAFAQGPGGTYGGGMMGGGRGFGGMMGGQGMMGGRGVGGMMGGQGMMGNGQGMMGGQGFSGMMGNGQGVGGMMGNAANPGNGQPVSFDKAIETAQQYLASYNNADLKVAEVMEFENNFYAVVKEQSSGRGAFELLVDRYSGGVHPEPGPNMMWNTKYGHMANGGMMGSLMGGIMRGLWRQQTGSMTVSVEQARTAAQEWLDANVPGAKLADDETTFYGYYTSDFFKDGKPVGMLSVNGYTGQVWYHTWHGTFISEKEL